MNQRINLNSDWDYIRQRASAAWLSGSEPHQDRVDLPHCWNLDDTFQSGKKYYRGWGCYRKSFRIEADPGVDFWELEIGGFYGTGTVWWNGKAITKIDGQFLGARIDLSNHAGPGLHVLAFELNNRHQRHVLPGIREPDFVLHGGLAASVALVGRKNCHLQPDSLSLVTESIEDPAIVRTSVAVADKQAATLTWQLSDESGMVASATSTELSTTLSIPQPRLWHPDHPHLYNLRIILESGGQVVDQLDQKVGIRQTEFRPHEGFFINGKHLPLRGINRHEKMPGLGNVFPPGLQREEAKKIKTLGLNLVRLSHYPQHPEFLNACDEMGLLVFPEIATWKSVQPGRWLKNAIAQLRGMMLRDRWRPSILCWGLANESRKNKAFRALQAVVEELDPTRPSIYAENHLYRGRRHNTLNLTDLLGVNYELDQLEEARDVSKNQVVLISEMSNYPHTIRGDEKSEIKQLETIKHDLQQLDQKAWVAGFTIWCMNDYATMRKNRYLRHSGVFDAWRQPKLAAHYLRARFSDEPFVEIIGDWSRENPNRLRDIHLLTNCPNLRLLQGEQVLQTVDNIDFFTAKIPFEDLPLRAEGHLDGQRATAQLSPHGPAHTLVLSGRPLDGPGWQEITLEVFDVQGNRVSQWNGGLSLQLTGGGRLLSYHPEGRVELSRGTGRCFVRSQTDTPYEINLTDNRWFWEPLRFNGRNFTIGQQSPD